MAGLENNLIFYIFRYIHRVLGVEKIRRIFSAT